MAKDMKGCMDNWGGKKSYQSEMGSKMGKMKKMEAPKMKPAVKKRKGD